MLHPKCCEKKTIREDDLKTDLTKRLNRIIGQMNGVKKMVDSDRYCADILIQLSAIDRSIKSLSNKILENHMHHCVSEGIKEGKDEMIDEVLDLIKRFN